MFADASPPTHLIDLVGRIAPRAVFLIYAAAVEGEERFNRAYYREAGSPKPAGKSPRPITSARKTHDHASTSSG